MSPGGSPTSWPASCFLRPPGLADLLPKTTTGTIQIGKRTRVERANFQSIETRTTTPVMTAIGSLTMSPESRSGVLCHASVVHDAGDQLAGLRAVEKAERLRNQVGEELVRMSRSTRRLTHARQ